MKLGFIGTGNMAGAMIQGILREGIVSKGEMMGSVRTEESCQAAKEKYGIAMTTDNRQVARYGDILFLAVKPQFYEEVIGQIRESIGEHQIIVTLAPGKTLAWLEEHFQKAVKLVRTMPNTPAMVGEGMTAICAHKTVNREELERVRELLACFGQVEEVPERLMDAVVAVSGSSPAYIFLLIEAMADGAVAEGMPRDQAYRFAAQSVYGSAKMVLETGKHPGELKDMVCSPGGTTIQAVQALEQNGFRSALMEAMKKCAEVSRRL